MFFKECFNTKDNCPQCVKTKSMCFKECFNTEDICPECVKTKS